MTSLEASAGWRALDRVSDRSAGTRQVTWSNTAVNHTITLVPGDGIGPEFTTATTKVIEAAGIDVE